jgi:hypothetical protein
MRASHSTRTQTDGPGKTAPDTRRLDGGTGAPGETHLPGRAEHLAPAASAAARAEGSRHAPDPYGDHPWSAIGSRRVPEDQGQAEADERKREPGKPEIRPARPLHELLTYEEYEEIPFTD